MAMVAEKAVMPSAARRIERIIVSFVQSLSEEYFPTKKNRIRFSPGEQLLSWAIPVAPQFKDHHCIAA
ncbi:hypothetical protein XI09_28965 [Bradyrhizobium sp. CCBAU 11386]|nr:hypothetical protein [Bradyrhizobium sp. CCBAU 11386]